MTQAQQLSSKLSMLPTTSTGGNFWRQK